jgi:hypothetical protein
VADVETCSFTLVMSRRMEIELTSARDGGNFTWRAAGAREPKGLLEGTLVPTGAKVGDVLRVEVEADIDGITILAVLPPREKGASTGRIEVVGTPKELVPVITTLAPGSPSQRGRGLFGRDRGDDGGPRGGRKPGRPSSGTRDRRSEGAPGGAAARGGEHRGRSAPRPEGARTESDRPTGERFPDGPPRGERPASQHDAGPARRRPPAAGGEERPGAGTKPARGRPPRFVPGRTHIDRVLAELPAEQRPIADQLVAGGIPAVRRALSESSDTANQAAILALAEQMLPAVKEALWLDRAEAAVEALEHLSLRDLRATVLGAVPRDDHGREVDRQLREALDQRVTKLRDNWQSDMARALEDGRVLQALRLSCRPPEPSARFPAPLVAPLSEAASASMTAETPAERWLALLEASVESPIRRYIKPAGLPTGADEVLLKAARQAAGKVPALAPLLGMTMPPPPGPASALRHPVPVHRPPHRPLPPRPAPVESKPVGTEPADTHPADTHPVDTAPVDVEPAPAEAADVAPTLVDQADAPSEPVLAEAAIESPAPAVVAEPSALEVEVEVAVIDSGAGDGVSVEEIGETVHQG